MDLGQLLDFTAGVGKCLLESGGETSRVEDTLTRIIKHFYNGYSEILVVLTGFFVSIGTYTITVRVKHRTINLDKVSKINKMSRDIVAGKIDFDEAVEQLKAIKERKPYPLWIKTLAVALSCGFFTMLQSGGWCEGLNSFIVGAALNVFVWILRQHHVTDFVVTLAGGAMIALTTVLLYLLGLGQNIDAMITGSIMPLVPGLAITNALRDIVAGDYISGGARLFDAVMVAVALAVGAGAMMYISGGTLI